MIRVYQEPYNTNTLAIKDSVSFVVAALDVESRLREDEAEWVWITVRRMCSSH